MNDNRNYVDSASNAEKKEKARQVTSKYGGANLEENVKKNGGENLDFENSLAISTNPAFKNQDLTRIENMTLNERKIAFIVAREKGQKAADQYMENLVPETTKREADVIKNLSSDSPATLYALSTLNDKNNRIDGFTQSLSFLNNDTDYSYKEETPLNYAMNDIKENGTPEQRAIITGTELQNDLIELALLKGGKGYVDFMSDYGDGYNQQMYKDEHEGNQKAIWKGGLNGIYEAGSNAILGYGIGKGMDKAGEFTKNFDITLPRNRYVDETVEKLGTDYIKNNLENLHKKTKK